MHNLSKKACFVENYLKLLVIKAYYIILISSMHIFGLLVKSIYEEHTRRVCTFIMK